MQSFGFLNNVRITLSTLFYTLQTLRPNNRSYVPTYFVIGRLFSFTVMMNLRIVMEFYAFFLIERIRLRMAESSALVYG